MIVLFLSITNIAGIGRLLLSLPLYLDKFIPIGILVIGITQYIDSKRCFRWHLWHRDKKVNFMKTKKAAKEEKVCTLKIVYNL